MNPLGLKEDNAPADTIYWLQVQYHTSLSNNKSRSFENFPKQQQ